MPISVETLALERRSLMVLKVSQQHRSHGIHPMLIFLPIQDIPWGQLRPRVTQIKPRIRGSHSSLHRGDGPLPHVLGNGTLNREIVASFPGTLRRVMGNHQRSGVSPVFQNEVLTALINPEAVAFDNRYTLVL